MDWHYSASASPAIPLSCSSFASGSAERVFDWRTEKVPNNLKHFAINANDVPRAKTFYQKTFGWKFTPWGPPGFYLIRTGTDDDPGVHGALQGRREIVSGKPMYGFECTIGVDSIDETIAAIEANGG